MFIGSLDKRIDVSIRTNVSDGRGGWTTTETFLGTFWGAVLPLSVNERAQYQQINRTVSTKIITRWNPLFNDRCRLVYRNRTYDVIGLINPRYDDRYLELVVSEV